MNRFFSPRALSLSQTGTSIQSDPAAPNSIIPNTSPSKIQELSGNIFQRLKHEEEAIPVLFLPEPRQTHLLSFPIPMGKRLKNCQQIGSNEPEQQIAEQKIREERHCLALGCRFIFR